ELESEHYDVGRDDDRRHGRPQCREATASDPSRTRSTPHRLRRLSLLHALCTEHAHRRLDLALRTDRAPTPLAEREAVPVGVAVTHIISAELSALPVARAVR